MLRIHWYSVNEYEFWNACGFGMRGKFSKKKTFENIAYFQAISLSVYCTAYNFSGYTPNAECMYG